MRALLPQKRFTPQACDFPSKTRSETYLFIPLTCLTAIDSIEKKLAFSPPARLALSQFYTRLDLQAT